MLRVRSSDNSRALAQLVKRLPTLENASGLIQSSNASITDRNKTSKQRRAITALQVRAYDGVESRHGSILFHTISHSSTRCKTILRDCPRDQSETTRHTRAIKGFLDNATDVPIVKSSRTVSDSVSRLFSYRFSGRSLERSSARFLERFGDDLLIH